MPVITAAAIGVGGSILGGMMGKKAGRSNAKLGAQLDYERDMKTEASLWQRAEERGLTPQEYYGSGAPGSATGASGSAQVIGNQQNAMAQQMGQLGQQAALTVSENQKNRDNAKEIAAIQAGAQKYGTDKQFEVAMGRLHLDTRQYLEIQIPQAAANINKTEHETMRLVNEIATSDPKFVKAMKIMTMGSDNSYGLAIQKMLGIDISDDKQMQSLSADQRSKLLAGLLSGGSTAAKELAGFSGSIEQWLDTMVQGGNALYQGAKDALTPGIQSTSPPSKPDYQLGNRRANRSKR